MRVIGIKFKKISAEKLKEDKKDTGKTIELKSNFTLTEVEKDDKISKMSVSPVYSFGFIYLIDYEDIASLIFEGSVFVELDEIKASEVERNKKNIDDDLKKLILDFVLSKTYIESLHLEERLGLPFHIRPPQVNFQKNVDTSESNNKKDNKK
jgi:hypothetical protein